MQKIMRNFCHTDWKKSIFLICSRCNHLCCAAIRHKEAHEMCSTLHETYICEFWTGNQRSQTSPMRAQLWISYERATAGCTTYKIPESKCVITGTRVANWRRASKLSSFLKRNTLFDISAEYLIEHSYALCLIVYARLYLLRILPVFKFVM